MRPSATSFEALRYKCMRPSATCHTTSVCGLELLMYKEEQMDRAADYHSSEEEDAKKHCSQCGKASNKVDRRTCESCGSEAWTFERIADEEEEEGGGRWKVEGGSNSTYTPSCPRLPAQSLVCVTAVPRNARKAQKK
jgi:hypothetical protein